MHSDYRKIHSLERKVVKLENEVTVLEPAMAGLANRLLVIEHKSGLNYECKEITRNIQRIVSAGSCSGGLNHLKNS